MIRILGTVVMLALFASLAPAEDRKTDTKAIERKDFDKTAPVDNDYLSKMFQCCNNADNLMVVVEQVTSSDKVKDFSKKVREDHSKMKKELAQVIKDKKLAIVATPDKELAERLNKLRKTEKGEFDREFLKYFVEGHEKVIKMSEHQKAHGKDKDITKLAEDVIKHAKDHLKEAKDLQKTIK